MTDPDRHEAPTAEDQGLPDTSGVGNWVEEGGPLEPQDVVDVEGAGGSAPADGPHGEVGGSEGGSAELAQVRQALTERTEDLQRLQAEFVNYKRRVERDRDLLKQNAVYSALAPITEVLDTVDRAREHGDLDPGLKAVAEQLERTVAAQGLVKFGAPGDAFDPTIHEALSHLGEDEGVEVTTCRTIAKSGYRIGERVVRAAQVLVVDPPAGR
ncbi:nucleotide exchange factor GrpE [Nocardioides nanhaiensis]|uniref:Protein GrpE n=1 Tax=Nocardioides nanhaiensis TaxID=1476871 RepID=A0ABP8VSA0_9ACTN